MRREIKCLHHVGISVPNLDLAKSFYAGTLGMTIATSRPWEQGDARMDQILGLEGSSGEKALLEGLNARIELWCFRTPAQGLSVVQRTVNQHGIAHICFEVAGLLDLYRELKSAGVQFVSEPSRGPTGSVAVYARDPFGNFLEFFQPPSPT